MPNWNYQLNLKDIWDWIETVADKNDEVIVQELVKKVTDRIVTAPFYTKHQNELDDIVQDFRESVYSIDEFDAVLDELYNWADQERCWVKTF